MKKLIFVLAFVCCACESRYDVCWRTQNSVRDYCNRASIDTEKCVEFLSHLTKECSQLNKSSELKN